MFKEIIDIIDGRLHAMLSEYEELQKPMEYSLFTGGKRFRPLLLLLILKDLGLEINLGLDVACAIEMIHTYSLIHDDLPAMDNDDMRRGQPTSHIVFGEDVAILTGDALLTEAFYWLSNTTLTDDIKIKIIKNITYLSGARGMIRGQILDIKNTESTKEHIELIHTHKTKDLIQSAIISASIIANQEDDIWYEFADYLGKAFQIKDDLDDIEKDEPTSIVKAIGIEKAQALFVELRVKCLNLVERKLGKKDIYQLVELVL